MKPLGFFSCVNQSVTELTGCFGSESQSKVDDRRKLLVSGVAGVETYAYAWKFSLLVVFDLRKGRTSRKTSDVEVSAMLVRCKVSITSP
jgi:hypothetical protein